ELHLLGRLLTDQKLVLVLAISDDPVVLLVAAHADRFRDNDPPERDHGDLTRPAADVQNHAAGRLPNREARTDRGRHRLLDQIGLPRPGRKARLLDGALLDPRYSGGHTHDDARMCKAV